MPEKNRFRFFAAVLLVLASVSAWAYGTSNTFSTTPALNNGEKWKVVFYEGGPHANYYHYLEATVLGLMKLGWIEKADLDDDLTAKIEAALAEFKTQYEGDGAPASAPAVEAEPATV